MPQFEMDKEGAVNNVTFADLCSFTQGYVEAMFWTECCTSYSMVEWDEPETREAVAEGQADGNIPADAGWGDLHPSAGESIQLDCFNFEADAGSLLREAYALGYTPEQAGHDFWLTRNGHGTGFWDREVLDSRDAWRELGSPRVGEPGFDAYLAAKEQSLGRKLSDIASEFGSVDVSFEPDPDSPTGYGYVYTQ